MIDDAFLRQVAALQANLKMLESQSDTLSDLADMKELRLYKARLADYIEANASAGQLPRDPFQVIEQRLIAVSEFFAAADQEGQRLKGWKADWLKSVPHVSLADLQSARTELDALVAAVPQIQESLAQRISPPDWDTSPSSLDLHAELLACAQCANGLKLPTKADKRQNLYHFSFGEGKLAKRILDHFTALGLRIEELITLHSDHVKAVAKTEHHLSNDDFRSAEKSFQHLGKDKFDDVDYTLAESRLAKALGVFTQFTSLDSSLDQLLEKGEYKAAKAKLDHLRGLIEKPDSELGRDCLALLLRMGSRFATAQKARRKSRLMTFAVISLSIVGLVVLSLYVINDNAKAERVRIEENAKAERVRIEENAKAEREAAEATAKLPAEIGAGRVGATLGVPLEGKAVMSFAFCPAGSFTMGSPSSEEGRSGKENQALATMSKCYWVAKTEVTQAQWQAVMGTNPSGFKGDDLPVENVSWSDVQEFIAKVNARGVIPGVWKMVLPTEAQWEYACRAGETGPYSGGSIEQLAWYDEKSEKQSHPVGTKKPNAWGLHDMHGNVWEWCADWHDDRLSGGTDPNGASSGVYRVLRGGSWNHDAAHCRAAFRSWHFPNSRSNELGFRPALVPSK
jgi:formylglycine-generating enzyme required for sulfatase activity